MMTRLTNDRHRPATRGRVRIATYMLLGFLCSAAHIDAQTADAQTARGDSLSRAPSGTRVRVRVLNGTLTRGLAKRATFLLRDLGYDVVDYDTDTKARRTETVIRSHTGHAEWAERLRRALGTGTIDVRSDSSRFVDFTVVIGSDWKAPPQSFRP